ncbi:MAG: GTP-binding protein [Ruminococcaceae bacterium]|nr:GTP-binding protein [Oscillospiraceae bacterium]
MTKIDIISGFLGAGKTTLIKKLLQEAFVGEKIVLIENEFGEIGIDGGFLKEAGVQITEMNSGCICCSLVGDFGTALKEVLDTYAPHRIIIEPSGVGKLSDVIAAVERVRDGGAALELNSFVTVVDALKCKIYMKNFGEFFNDQVAHASAILLSRSQSADEGKLHTAVELLRGQNPKAAILTTPWDRLTGKQILDAMAGGHDLAGALMEEMEHHHHHHDHGEHCDCGCHDHHHHEHHHEHEHEHEHHHDHGEHCDCGCHDHDHHHEHHHEHEHEHHHDHGEHCDCGCHDHHHHHADEVFTSWGRETPRKYSREELQDILSVLAMSEDMGTVLRAKGMVPCAGCDHWLHFDLVPGEFEIREGGAEYTGRLCVIGSGLDEAGLEKLFFLG